MGIAERAELAVVKPCRVRRFPGADYRLVMDLFNAALLKRVTPTEMAERIIQSVPEKPFDQRARTPSPQPEETLMRTKPSWHPVALLHDDADHAPAGSQDILVCRDIRRLPP